MIALAIMQAACKRGGGHDGDKNYVYFRQLLETVIIFLESIFWTSIIANIDLAIYNYTFRWKYMDSRPTFDPAAP